MTDEMLKNHFPIKGDIDSFFGFEMPKSPVFTCKHPVIGVAWMWGGGTGENFVNDGVGFIYHNEIKKFKSVQEADDFLFQINQEYRDRIKKKNG